MPDFVSGDVRARFARGTDAPALRRLFGAVFGESEAGLDLFFSRAFDPSRAAVAVCGGKVAGMFHILPARLRVGSETRRAAYLYALAVDPAYRGRGAAGEILRFLDGALPRSRFEAAVLMPAEASLFGFYARFGYETAFTARRLTLGPEAIGAAPRGTVVPARLSALPEGRAHYFGGCEALFDWGADMLRYADDYLALYGWKTVRIETPDGAGYAVFRIEGGRLYAAEIGGTPRADLLAALAAHAGARHAEALVPAFPPGANGNEAVPRAQIKWFSGALPFQNGYFSLGLE